MIAGDLGTVSELNARARADRIAAGAVTEDGLTVAGGGTAGVGDLVVTRQNDRRLATGRRWVRNGDRWTVTATEHDGSMTVQRANGGGMVVLPAAYVAEHVELAYASTAHRAQGRTRRHRARHGLSDHHPRGALRLGHQGPRVQPALRRHPLRP